MKPVAAAGLRVGCIALSMTACSLLHTNDPGNETFAIVSIRAIQTAQVAYSTECGNGGYATSLAVLGEPPPGKTAGYLDASFTQSEQPEKAGYRFTLAAGDKAAQGPKDCHGHPTVKTYYATATPLKFNSTGTRSFAANQEDAVWQVAGPTAPTEPFGPPAVPVQ